MGFWKTIVQAWNVAWQRNVGEAFGSTGNLARAVPVALFVSSPTDALVSVGSGEAIVAGIPKGQSPAVFRCDPASLTWADVRRIVGATVVERGELLEALVDGDTKVREGALAAYVAAVAAHLPPILNVDVPAYVWYVARGAAGLAVWLGHPEAPRRPALCVTQS